MTSHQKLMLLIVTGSLSVGLGCENKGQDELQPVIQQFKETELKLEKTLSRYKTLAVDSGPVQITSPGGGQCVANPGAYQLPNPATGAKLQWGSPGVAYNIIFQAHQNPADPGNSAVTTIPVPAGKYSDAIVVAQAAQDGCTSTGQCVYTYTISPSAPGSCMGSSGTFGFIIKP